MKKIVLTLSLIILSISYGFAQLYNMSNAPVTTCSGSFYDSGGSAGSYLNSESYTKTFTPNLPGNKLIFTFNTFDTESCCDHLSIYDGPNTTFPLIGTYQGIVSPGTITATSAGGQLTFVWTSDLSVTHPGWDATISCFTPSPMVYVSSTTTQNTTITTPGAISQQIIGIQVVTTGTLTPLNATSFSFNTTGSTNALNDIQNARLWYTGLSGTFATTTQNGATIAAPNGAFTINGFTQALSQGTNYFWLSYDIKPGATIGDVVDATCTSLTTSGTPHVPTVTAPAGNRLIVDCPCGTGYVNAGNLSAPYASGALTTCGQIDDITSLNVSQICNSSLYYGGEDVVYYFTPSTSGYIDIAVTSSGSYMGLMLYQGCPLTSGVCIGAAQSSLGDQTLGVCVTAGVKYYLVIDSWPSPTCNPYSLTISVPTGSGPPANDEPCNATTLTVNPGGILYTTGSNYCATPSQILQPGLAAPGCGSYMGGDVWFKFTVPASGRVIVDMNSAGSLTDCDMAWYTGPNCSNLNTLVECDDFDSQNGSFAMICRAGSYCMVPGNCQQNATLTPGSTVYVRVWEYGNNLMGDFLIGAWEPGPSGTTSNCGNATVISSIPYSASGLTTCCKINDYTSADACLSSYMNGEDYVFTYTPATNVSVNITVTGTGPNCGLFVTQKCPNAGGATCIAQATSATGNPDLCAVALTAGVTYYIIVDTWPAPNCTNFNISINNSSFATCGLPYTVSSIAHNPLPYVGAAINIPIDDTFSSIYVPIGFPFCFDGIQYSQLLVSSNAYAIFDPIACATNLPAGVNAAPNGYSAWSISAAIPNTTNAPRNSIMFPWMDVNPALGGNITFNTVGVTPNRKFYISFDNVPLYSCTSNRLTSQLILYETTNTIEVHIARRDACPGWNGSAGIVGLHNYNGTQAVFPAGHNYPTAWTATNQAWRFTTSCTQCLVLLPIELADFSAKCDDHSRIISWTTTSEINNDFFTLERSKDGENFEVLTTINGAGNSNSPQHYSYKDFAESNGTDYYRLKQTDFDGKFKYFPVQAINCDNSEAPNVLYFPNPFSSEIVIELANISDNNATIELFDMIGNKVFERKLENISETNNKFMFDLSSLSSGIYFANFKSNDFVKVSKITKK